MDPIKPDLPEAPPAAPEPARAPDPAPPPPGAAAPSSVICGCCGSKIDVASGKTTFQRPKDKACAGGFWAWLCSE
jgi:hypothetical protein